MGQALLLAFEPFDRAHLRSLRTLTAGLFTLRHPLLDALVHVTRVLAQHVREVLPLGLLRVGDVQRRADVREARFHALARHAKSALLACAAMRHRAFARGRACATSSEASAPSADWAKAAGAAMLKAAATAAARVTLFILISIVRL